MYERILVPTDGSKNAHAAVTEAIALAKVLGSELFIVAVATDQSYNHYGAKFGGEIMDHFREEAAGYLKLAADEAAAAGVKASTSFKVGLPKPTIAQVLPEDFDTSLTVIGRSGSHGIGRAIMGATTTYVVQHSDTSVLVVD